jgi:hypothetical protein
MECGAGRPAGGTDCRKFAVHHTVMTGRSLHLLPNIYHRYALSGTDCTHVCTSDVRICMSGYHGRSVVQLPSLARAGSRVAVRV